MLEKECIQSKGFKNTVVNNEVVGFQLDIRSLYYRGVWLSQLRPATVKVDGEIFEEKEITWTINGVTYEQDELKSLGDIHWNVLDVATLSVRKNGGLESGSHDVEVNYLYSSSYFPPQMDTALGAFPHVRKLILV